MPFVLHFIEYNEDFKKVRLLKVKIKLRFPEKRKLFDVYLRFFLAEDFVSVF